MKNRRLGVAFLMALVVSLVVSFFLYNRIKGQYARNSRSVKIMAAAKALDPGAVITANDVTQIDWPMNFLLEGSFTKPQDVVGRVAVLPIGIKEPIREALLAAPGAVGLTTKIPDGMRAVAVETNDVTNVAGFLFPGCHVDVLVTFRPDEGGRGGNANWMTSTVLQNIQVLSTGERLQPDPSGKPQKVRQVTMLLTPDDAQKLVLASAQGTVQFVLRNGSDQAQADRRPVQFKDLEISSVPRPAAVAVKKAPPPPTRPRDSYEIETYDGTKKGVVKF
jgi:pilus assembly protein CpaB